MNILVIGGTIFVGRHIVQAALDRGHKVTLFNRGKVNAELFPEADKLTGDRTRTLDALRGKSWDAVIDTCGYVPNVVCKSAEALQSACDLYVFISTGSVYKDKSKFGITDICAQVADHSTGTYCWAARPYGSVYILASSSRIWR